MVQAFSYAALETELSRPAVDRNFSSRKLDASVLKAQFVVLEAPPQVYVPETKTLRALCHFDQ
jgi:hypothetical protein